MLRETGLFGAGAATALMLCGCAATTEADTAALAGEDPAARGAAAGPAYQLSKDELALDCKKLTGRMQVRILQIRGYETTQKATVGSRLLQSATATVLGGSKEGADPDGRYAKDRAMLEAYNGQLAAKGCRTFDLAAELGPKPVDVTPTPVAKAKTEPSTAAP